MNSGTNSFPNREGLYEYHVQTYSFGPVDGTTYYFSGDVIPPTGGSSNITRAFGLKVPAVIVGANIELHSVNAGASGEAIPMYIQVNGTDDYLVQNSAFPQTVAIYNQRCSWYNMNMNILLKPTDIFIVKMVSPTWVTNPTQAVFTGTIFYKTRI